MIIEAFRQQSDACSSMGSLFTAHLCDLFAAYLDSSTAIGALCFGWEGDPGPSADSLPLRLCGGLHAVVLSGQDEELAKHYPSAGGDWPVWEDLERVLIEHEEFLLNWMTSPPQTNEVSRSGVIWPALMEVARLTQKPLSLLEVGASGGLNLQACHFAYDLDGMVCGDTDSSLTLKPEWKGNTPTLASVEISDRAGCDINPLDPTSAQDALRLRSYVWADQTDRHDRLNKALQIAGQYPVKVDREDAVTWLSSKLAKLDHSVCTVIYSTIAWQYLPQAARAAGEELIVRQALQAKDKNADLAWLRFEADGQTPGAAIRLQLWSKDVDAVLGRADFHGRWVDWVGLAS